MSSWTATRQSLARATKTFFNLRGVGNRERRKLLVEALGNGTEHIRFSTAFAGDPRPILERACACLEGLIAKRVNAPYVSSRSSAWLKLKCNKRQEFVVCGFTDRSDDPKKVGNLLLGVSDNGALIPVGSVGTGWTAQAAKALRKSLAALEQKECPFAGGPGKQGRWSRPAVGSEYWIEPVIVAEIHFVELPPDGQVRHASFVGLREDKDPAAVMFLAQE